MAANPPYIHFALMRWRCSEIRILLRLLREGGMKMYIYKFVPKTNVGARAGSRGPRDTVEGATTF